MSRTSTSTASTTTQTHTTQLPHEKISMRAYEKWCKRGRPQGTDKMDWLEAEAELRTEMNRTQGQQQTQGHHAQTQQTQQQTHQTAGRR